MDQTKHIRWLQNVHFAVGRTLCIHSCNCKAERFYINLQLIFQDNTISLTSLLYCIVQSLINTNTKTMSLYNITLKTTIMFYYTILRH